MNTEFTPGDILFSERGQQAEFVARSSRGFVVRPIYEGNDEEPSYAGIEEWDRVFSEAPAYKWNATILELEGKAMAIRKEIEEIRREKVELEKDSKDRMARLKQHKNLELLDLFLAGRITHYFIDNSYGPPTIMELKDAVSDENRFNKPLRLLSLYGKSDGDLSWRLGHYSDSSGGSCEVAPCTSYEMAIEKLKEWAQIRFDLWRRDEKELNGALRAAEACPKYGVGVPDDVVAAARDIRKRVAFQAVEAANKALESAQAKLNEASCK